MSYTWNYHRGVGIIVRDGLTYSFSQIIAVYFAPFFHGQKLRPEFGRFRLIMDPSDDPRPAEAPDGER
jgi:hypothetical protein